MSSLNDTGWVPPFWRPFLLALMLGIPGSAAWAYAALSSDLYLRWVVILTGVLCGVGVRFADGTFYPAFLAILIHTVTSVLVVTLILLGRYLEMPAHELILVFIREGQWQELANISLLVAENNWRSAQLYPMAFLAAYFVVTYHRE
jgi:hypothetical protein